MSNRSPSNYYAGRTREGGWCFRLAPCPAPKRIKYRTIAQRSCSKRWSFEKWFRRSGTLGPDHGPRPGLGLKELGSIDPYPSVLGSGMSRAAHCPESLTGVATALAATLLRLTCQLPIRLCLRSVGRVGRVVVAVRFAALRLPVSIRGLRILCLRPLFLVRL